MSRSSQTNVTVYIGLGSNLENPINQVQSALIALAKISGTQLIKHSSLYKSSPMGPQDQDDYINAVAEISTKLSPVDLLEQLQKIEDTHGRQREQEQWGPRTLDLDLLLYGKEFISTPRLTVPHYGIKTRMFVLLPLSEIAPTLKLPDNSSVSKLMTQLASQASPHRIYKL